MMESNDRSKWHGDDEQAPAKSGRNGPSVALIVALVLAVLAIVWFFQNSHTVTITFLFADRTVSVRMAIIIAIALGVAARPAGQLRAAPAQAASTPRPS